MKDGIKRCVNVALDTKDELFNQMVSAGVDPQQALLASTVATKANVSAMIDRHFGNCNAAEFTNTLKTYQNFESPQLPN